MKKTKKKTLPLLSGAPDQLVDELRQQVRRLETVRPREQEEESFSSGCRALDVLLPEGGFKPGSLVEWLSAERASGAGSLALIAAREASLSGGAVVVMDRRRSFFPPAAAALGVDLENVIVIRADNDRDEIWALEQALRCPGVAAAWAPLEDLDPHSSRRLQLAVEGGGGLGLLLRPAKIRGQPSWSDVQLLVSSRAGRSGERGFQLEVTRVRGGPSGARLQVEMDEVTGALQEASRSHDERGDNRTSDAFTPETHALHLAAQLAHPAAGRRTARA